jgi:peptide deformylase
MAVLRIHTVPGDDAFLRRIAAEVTEFGPALKQIAADMLETLPSTGGVGLAAPQVGHSIRMVLVDISHTGGDEEAEGAEKSEPPAPRPPPPFFLCNPVILGGTGEASLAEGCLSVPGLRVEVPRLAEIDVEAHTLEGKRIRFQATDFLAIVIQHEMDHLEGRLIVDWAAKGCKSFNEDEVPEDLEVLD